MSMINTGESFTTPTNTEEATSVDDAASVDSTTSSGAISDDVVMRVSYSNDQAGDGSGGDGGDSADANGLTFPSFNIDMKETMLLLASLQSKTSESKAEFTSDQIESLLADKFDEAAKNVDRAAKARAKHEEAEFWGDVSRIAGYVATGLVLLLAVATCNPVLMVAGIAMIACMCMNETGATGDVINAMGNGNTLAGTIALGVCIGALSVASGGAAGLTIATTMAPALLFTPENLQSMGVSEEASIGISIAVCVTCALVGGFGAARMCSGGAVAQKAGSADDVAGLADDAAAGSKLAGAGDDVAGVSDDAAGLGDDAAGMSDDAVKVSDDAASVSQSSSSSTYESARKTAKSLMDAAEDTSKTVDEAATLASKIKRLARMVADGRLEKLLNKGMPNVLNASDDAAQTAKLTETMVRLNQASTGMQAVLDLVVTSSEIAVATYSKETAKLEAQADMSTAKSQYASTLEGTYEQMLSNVAEAYNSSLGKTRDAIATIDTSTRGHLQFAI